MICDMLVHHEVRFHLSSGKNYKHWQVKTYRGGEYESNYYDPNSYGLVLYDCELVNKSGIARQVFSSQRRDVCGWVRCSGFDIVGELAGDFRMVVYDPKVRVHWHYGDEVVNIDGMRFDKLFTIGKRVYCER
jgi:hypothetical protein